MIKYWEVLKFKVQSSLGIVWSCSGGGTVFPTLTTCFVVRTVVNGKIFSCKNPQKDHQTLQLSEETLWSDMIDSRNQDITGLPFMVHLLPLTYQVQYRSKLIISKLWLNRKQLKEPKPDTNLQTLTVLSTTKTSQTPWRARRWESWAMGSWGGELKVQVVCLQQSICGCDQLMKLTALETLKPLTAITSTCLDSTD